MKIEQFHILLSNPSLLKPEDEIELGKIVERYPFFNLPHILLAFKKKNDKDSEYPDYLSRAAIHTGDRKKLYEFVIQSGLQEKITSPPLSVAKEEEKTTLSVEAPVKMKEEKDTELKKLEESILTEAINSSIQLELQAYRIEDALPVEQTSLAEQVAPEVKEEINLTTERSFADWLKLGIGEEKEEKPKKSRRDEIAILVDQFIANEPKISPKKTEFFSPANVARMSLVENEDFVTETLAKIYHNQKNYERAIKAYQQLILKIPKKKSFFAAQIEFIKEELKQSKK